MNEIQLYKQFTPANIIEMGMVLGKSGNFGFTKAEQGVTALMICICDNISLATFLRTYHTMPDGKFSKKAMAAFAEFRSKGGKVEWKKTGDETSEKPDDRAATGTFDFENQKLTVSYSIADAKKEGVFKAGSRYEKRPGQMLRARVLTNALGMLAPEIFAGEDEGDYIAPATDLDLAKPAVVQTVVEVSPAAATSPAKDNEAELAKAGLAPVQPAAPAGVVSNPAPPLTGFTPLDPATVTKICEHLGMENMPKVTDWLVANFWINSNGDLSSMPAAKANQLLRTEKSKCFKNFQITLA